MMRRHIAAPLLFAAGIALSPALLAAPDPEVAALLDRAEFWQARSRDDRAREEIDKALRLRPDQPEALLALGRLQLRANQEREAAATLQRLRNAHPQHVGVAHLGALLRIRGADRDRLRQARQLARAGRNDEAPAAFSALFPEGAPDDDLALEIAQVQGWTRNGWEPARATLAELARRHASLAWREICTNGLVLSSRNAFSVSAPTGLRVLTWLASATW